MKPSVANHPWFTHLDQRLDGCLQRDQLPHALLLSGPGGLGKLAFARDFAAQVMCAEFGAGEGTGASPIKVACGQCPSCRQLAADGHPDFRHVTLEINEKTNKLRTRISVDQIRALSQAFALTLSTGQHRVAIIEPAELMNAEAANALLKTLEEPPPRTLIILVTARPDRLPVTILSRCQHLAVAMPTIEQCDGWLQKQGFSSEHDRRLARVASAGSPGSALRLLQSGQLEAVQRLTDQVQRILAGRSDAVLAADQWSDEELPDLLGWMGQLSADLLRCRLSSSEDPGWGESLHELAAQVQVRSLFSLREVIHQAAYEAEGSIRKDLLRDDIFMAWGRCAASRA